LGDENHIIINRMHGGIVNSGCGHTEVKNLCQKNKNLRPCNADLLPKVSAAFRRGFQVTTFIVALGAKWELSQLHSHNPGA
jgi:hypothetical protein